MGYLYTVLSVLLGAAKGYCGKSSSRYMQSGSDAVLLNLFRMLICSVIGFFIVLQSGGALPVDNTIELWIILLSAISTALFVISWLLCAREDAYILLDAFLLIGAIIPISVCFFLFQEPIYLNQIIAIGILIVAIYFLCGFNKQLKGKMSKKSLTLLFLCGMLNGCTDLSQKLYVKAIDSPNIARFQFYTYLFSFGILLIFHMGIRKKQEPPKNPYIRQMLLYVLLMAVCLFGCSYFKTLAANFLSSAQLYPLSQGLALILSSLMSAFLFHEKLTKKAMLGIALAFVSVLMLNI